MKGPNTGVRRWSSTVQTGLFLRLFLRPQLVKHSHWGPATARTQAFGPLDALYLILVDGKRQSLRTKISGKGTNDLLT